MEIFMLQFVLASLVSSTALSSFAFDYGNDKATITSNDLEITLDEQANGARLVGPPQERGKICSTVSLELVSGSAFAMYLSTDEPKNRQTEKWDELDFEFINTIGQGNVWVNTFHDGKDLQAGGDATLGSTSAGSSVTDKRYCIHWDIKDKAVWTIDNVVVRVFSLQGWSKPLKPYFSYWGIPLGADADASLIKWFGKRTEKGSHSCHAKNVEYGSEPEFPSIPVTIIIGPSQGSQGNGNGGYSGNKGYGENGGYGNQGNKGYGENGGYGNQGNKGYGENGGYGNQGNKGYGENGGYGNQGNKGYGSQTDMPVITNVPAETTQVYQMTTDVPIATPVATIDMPAATPQAYPTPDAGVGAPYGGMIMTTTATGNQAIVSSAESFGTVLYLLSFLLI
ncbi:hypothetical protein HDV01_001916 [Terramyces sp. JEL0728]|nr:hypothetical protein HDV01_001916 [Terramyces sp. JEL0728]